VSTVYRVAEVVSPDLVRIVRADRTGSEVALWSRRRLRKATRCAVMDVTLAAGEFAYGPVGNQRYRYERISARALPTLDAR